MSFLLEGIGPTKGTVFYRSAGACPPRSQHSEGQALALREEEAFFNRSAGACPPRSQHSEGQAR